MCTGVGRNGASSFRPLAPSRKEKRELPELLSQHYRTICCSLYSSHQKESTETPNDCGEPRNMPPQRTIRASGKAKARDGIFGQQYFKKPPRADHSGTLRDVEFESANNARPSASTALIPSPTDSALAVEDCEICEQHASQACRHDEMAGDSNDLREILDSGRAYRVSTDLKLADTQTTSRDIFTYSTASSVNLQDGIKELQQLVGQIAVVSERTNHIEETVDGDYGVGQIWGIVDDIQERIVVLDNEVAREALLEDAIDAVQIVEGKLDSLQADLAVDRDVLAARIAQLEVRMVQLIHLLQPGTPLARLPF